MCEICGCASRSRICEECMEALEHVEASVLNRLVHELSQSKRPPKVTELEDYEDFEEGVS